MENELLRLKELNSYNILDTSPQEMFDDITLLASQICDVPIALISLIDEDRQWFKSKLGLDASETPREYAFCSVAIRNPNELFIVPNALQDSRFSNNPLVVGDPNIRFYAGAPLLTKNGFALGTLCVIDTVPRKLTDKQLNALSVLRRNVITALELRKALIINQKIDSELKESQSNLYSIINHMPAMIGYWDTNLINKFSNINYVKWFGLTPEQIKGKHIREVIGESLYQQNLKYMRAALEGNIQHFERTIPKVNNEIGYSLASYIPDIIDNQVHGFFVLVSDITDLKKSELALQNSEQKLQEINATKDKLFNIIAHDLKGPIGSLSNLTSILHDEFNEINDDDKLHYTDVINKTTTNIYALLSDLLAWAGSQRGQIEPKFINFKLNDFVKDIILLLIKDANLKLITINNKLLEDYFVYADKDIVSTVLRNLIANAIKFTPNNGEVIIDAKEKGEFIQVSIADNGVGMDVTTLNKLFKIGEHITSKGTNNELGTGLGLILCKEFIDKINGNIWVESKEGIGSTFYFTVPKNSLLED